MKNIYFPVKFKFHITTFSNDFTATDANGQTLAYIRQKKFRLKEHVQVFDNGRSGKVLYNIKADRWLDFNASYTVFDEHKQSLGTISRKGIRSFFKATYTISDPQRNDIYSLKEKNPITKFLDDFVGGIPLLGFLTGYIFNPSYILTHKNGQPVMELLKEPSFFGRKFTLKKLNEMDEADETLLVLSFMMMILLERDRG